MTAINQNALADNRSVDDLSRHPEDKKVANALYGKSVVNDDSHDSIMGTVSISFNAQMRLRAYQDQTISPTLSTELLSVDPLVPPKESTSIAEKSVSEKTAHINSSDPIGKLNLSNKSHFSNKISQILFEVEQNIVQTSEPGYRYLVNMLNNYQADVENPEQLQEIMRKEEFYLKRRKPFMESAEFQSHSQVLSQFSNIIARQQ